MCDNVYAEIEDMIGHYDTKLISDANLPYLVRQMAVHANVSACISIVSSLRITLLVVIDTVFHQKKTAIWRWVIIILIHVLYSEGPNPTNLNPIPNLRNSGPVVPVFMGMLWKTGEVLLHVVYNNGVGNTIEENSSIYCIIWIVLVVISKGMQTVKLCSSKILQFLTGGAHWHWFGVMADGSDWWLARLVIKTTMVSQNALIIKYIACCQRHSGK